MVICRVCKTELTEVNWYLSFQKREDHICKECWTKQYYDKYYGQKKKEYFARQKSSKKEYRDKIKTDVLTHYSNGDIKCANPFDLHKEPFLDRRALTIDHIAGGGNQHMKKLKLEGTTLCLWIRKNNYPPGFQILCMNCQLIKADINNERRISKI